MSYASSNFVGLAAQVGWFPTGERQTDFTRADLTKPNS